MSKNLLFYVITLLVSLFLIGFVLDKGEQISTVAPIVTVVPPDFWHLIVEDLLDHLRHPVSLLLVQLLIIIVLSRVLGSAARLIAQPSVIGEIIAGIVLGPSLVGMFVPEFTEVVFPVDSLPKLQLFSQLGLILFMFIIGMELDVKILKYKAEAALTISHASIVFPYLFGVILSYFIYHRFAPEGTTFISFALFMGIAMSITAFPILARVVQERGLSQTVLGTVVITAAAIDDVTAWCILALVVALVKAGTITHALVTILFSVVYVLFMVLAVRPFLNRVAEIYSTKEYFNKTIMALVLGVMIFSAYIAELIGIHALFGAFLAGAIMPQHLHFKEIIREKIEDVSSILLLPLFFVFTGLRTQIGLINSLELWEVFGWVMLVAVAGKFGGSLLAARMAGQRWSDSFIIGILMNTRGLMELIVLNIGYDLGILNPEIFAIMVLMALTTTFMTGPALDAIDWLKKRKQEKAKRSHVFKILISFGPPEMGSTLLQLVHQLILGYKPDHEIAALHLTPSTEISMSNALLYEEESFRPIQQKAAELNIPLKTIYKTTEKVKDEIILTSDEGQFDLLLMGSARSLFAESETSGIVRNILSQAKANVGVFISKNSFKLKTILLIEYPNSTLKQYNRWLYNNYRFSVDKLQMLPQNKSVLYKAHENKPINTDVEKSLIAQYDLVILSLNDWKELFTQRVTWLSALPSVLIVKGEIATVV